MQFCSYLAAYSLSSVLCLTKAVKCCDLQRTFFKFKVKFKQDLVQFLILFYFFYISVAVRKYVSCCPNSFHPLPFFTGEEASVFKCSVSRETECSRVGKQSFIITLGCNSVLLQFSSPAGTHKHPNTIRL